MTERLLTRSAIFGAAMMALAGCGSISSSLGLERHVPDETQVVVRPALTLPPDYDLMPPGTPSPVSGDHESGSSMAAAGVESGTPQPKPKKEEEGFFGRLFDWGLSDDDDKTASPAAGTPAAPPADAAPAPNVEGTPVPPPPAKTSSLSNKIELKFARAAMIDPDAQAQSPAATPIKRPKRDPNYIGDFFSDMGSLVGLSGDTSAKDAAPVQVAGASAQEPAPQPVVRKPTPDYVGDFFSDMGSLVGLGGAQKTSSGANTASK